MKIVSPTETVLQGGEQQLDTEHLQGSPEEK